MAVKALSSVFRDRVPVTFLLPPTLARAITEAAQFSGNLICQNMIVTDHIVLARPPKMSVKNTLSKRVRSPIKNKGGGEGLRSA
jgi:hypothetical protein